MSRIRTACWLCLGLGAALRVWMFVHRGEFWIDEAALASNIVDRSWSEIARPFVYEQLAPYLYMLMEKLVTLPLGVSELSLRLPSLVFGVLLLPGLALLAKPMFGWPGALCAIALSSCSEVLIYYSTELKPYMGDALVATALLVALQRVLFSAALREPRQARGFLPLVAAGALAPWLSLPSIFVLAAVSAALCVHGIEGRRDREYWRLIGTTSCLWLVSFVAHYALVLRMRPEDAESMRLYWSVADGFAPWPLRGLRDLHWFGAKAFYLFALFAAPGGHGIRYLMAAVWCIGLVQISRTSRALALALVAPLVCLFCATALRAYVMTDRVLLFAAPSIIVPCAGAIAFLASARPPVSQLLAAWLMVGIGIVNASSPAMQSPAARSPDGIRNAIAYVRAQARPGDVLYIEELTYWAATYYAKRAGLRLPTLAGEAMEHVFARFDNPLQVLAGRPRVWVLFSLGYQRGERLLVERLSALGTRISQRDASGVRVYLYDLSTNKLGPSRLVAAASGVSR